MKYLFNENYVTVNVDGKTTKFLTSKKNVKEVLKDRIFWIKGLDKEDAARWKELCFSHNNPTFHNGYFILEHKE